MKSDAVPVLRMGENTPLTRRPCSPRISAQINLNAAATAMTVTARLTHGPQTIAPAMTVIAKSGKNNLPSTCLAFEKKSYKTRPMISSFPLRLSSAS